jgi:HK97 family phage prohead protease
VDFPVDQLLAPVEGHDDLTAFRFDFSLGEKALGDQIVEETEDGDLIIEGYAAVFDGLDRQGENFVDGAFKRGVKAFLDSQAALCFHHKKDMVLGKVLDLREEEGKGLKMRARVDGAIKNHPVLGTIYHQIKRGTLNGLSVQGFFGRIMTPSGPRIGDVDLTEISITGVPIHPGAKFSVLAGKALGDTQLPLAPDAQEEIRSQIAEFEQEINGIIGSLDNILTNLGKAVMGAEETTTEETKEEEVTTES